MERDSLGRRKSPQQREGFATQTARLTGRSKRQINRDLRIARILGDDLERVTGTCLEKGVELDALSRLPPDLRADLIDRVLKGERHSARTWLQVIELELRP